MESCNPFVAELKRIPDPLGREIMEGCVDAARRRMQILEDEIRGLSMQSGSCFGVLKTLERMKKEMEYVTALGVKTTEEFEYRFARLWIIARASEKELKFSDERSRKMKRLRQELGKLEKEEETGRKIVKFYSEEFDKTTSVPFTLQQKEIAENGDEDGKVEEEEQDDTLEIYD